MSTSIRLFIIDDHQIVRDGLKALFREVTDIILTGESDGTSEVNIPFSPAPDIVLMDISLGKRSGIDLSKELLQKQPHLNIIILSMLASEEVVLSAIEAGARGFLPKNTSREEMLKAIYEVHKGHTYYHSEIAEIMVKSMLNRRKNEEAGAPCVDCLSKREIQIIELYAQGFTNQEIADRLFISIRTVESHKTHIMQKLGFKSTVEMVKFALKNKLIELN